MHFRFPFLQSAKQAPAKKSAGTSSLTLIANAVQASGSQPLSFQHMAAHGFMSNPIAHRAIRLVSETASAVDWLLYDGEREIEEHEWLSVLKRPNPQMAGPDFFETLYGQLLLSGNAYIERIVIDGRIKELHLLRPDRVSIRIGADGWPNGYDYRTGAGRVRVLQGAGAEGPILHLRLFHPLDDHYGLSPLSAAAMALDLSNASVLWNKRLLDNSARPSGALVYQPKEGGNLTPDQYQRLKNELEEGYAGAVNAGRPLLLEGGLDWKSMGLSPKDMDFLEAKNSAARDIALALGVPPLMLGLPGDNTHANYQEANRAFYRLTILPLLKRIGASLSNWLSEGQGEGRGKGLHLQPDLDGIAGLTGERDALWTRVEGASFLSDKEKRAAVGY
jgi:HK97 family phage portal protein